MNEIGEHRRRVMQDIIAKQEAERVEHTKQVAAREVARIAAKKEARRLEALRQDEVMRVAREIREEKNAFQEQLRHKRKEAFQAAKQTDIALHAACDEDDAAVKAQSDDKKKLHAFKTSADGFEVEAKELDAEIKRLQLLWRSKRGEYGHTKDLMHQHAVNMAIRSPKRTQAKVTEAYATCDEAWAALPTALVKKSRDRTAKKRAKVIRGRTSS